jgi:hypothetical protein
VLSAFQSSSSININLINPTTFSSGAFVDFVLISGLMTDELESGKLGGVQTDYQADDINLLLDTRQLPEGVEGVQYDPDPDQLYTELQGIRNSATLAIGALVAYDTVDSPALRGQLYALQGYSELFLADLYCSGVPLSTLDFAGDFTYHAGSTTTQLYQAAVAKFDTALALSSDSARILNFARVGKGRAFLALAEYDSAAVAVDSVTTGYSYQFLVNWNQTKHTGGGTGIWGGVTEADRQGTTGLPYLSSGDPRTAAATWWTNQYGVPQYAPIKYGGTSLGSESSPVVTPITVASGIEARLIQAEAAYHGVTTGTGDWFAQLNALRQTAITPALPGLSDPGSSPGDTARINLLFRERAYWLFLTGQRQGDLRRLIRNYQLAQTSVYPTGAYPLFGAFQQYGTDVTVPIPPEEHVNPLFTGCLSRGA